MATSVLRRYTPPTCTLEIAATGSALSRWTDRTLLKNLRFQLSFDDPKLPEDEQVTIRGDRTQLETLCDVVGNYVQKMLTQMPTDRDPDPTLGTGHGSDVRSDVTAAIAASLGQLKAGAENGATHLTDKGVYLKPKGLTAHTLHLGNLIEGDREKAIPLTATQLFDLANALDEYSSEADALPDLSRPKGIKSPATWGKIAAGLVLVAGTSVPLAMFVRQVANPAGQVANREVEMTTANAPPLAPGAPSLPPPPAPLSTSPSLKLEPIAPPGTPGAAITVPPAAPGAPPVVVGASPAPQTAADLPPVAVNPNTSTFNVQENNVQENAQPVTPSSVPVAPAVPQSPPRSPSTLERQRALEAANPPAPEVEAALSQADALNPSAIDFGASSAGSARSAAAPAADVSATVQSSLQALWQPIQGVNQDLSYNMNLGADGSVIGVEPMGDTSAQNQAKVPLPGIGQVIAPNPNGQTSRLRVVFSPDGNVRVVPR